ncbi:hypothetical protein PRIPAC_80823, partial [Pristionchus pacificus]
LQMSLSSIASLMESNCKVNGGSGNFFDLLGCPDEIIDQIFSYLNLGERLRMRLNKRLHRIEAESKYYVGRMLLTQMSLSKYVPQKEGKCEVNGGMGDSFNFDLLGCPDEVIDEIFSFLDPEERMRMRLNKRLQKIVDESKYYLEKVDLIQYYCMDNRFFSGMLWFEKNCFNIKNRKYRCDFIRIIAHNASIGRLSISFPESVELIHKFCNIIKEFRSIKVLWIDFPTRENADEIMTNSFFIDLSRRCEILNLTSCARNFYQISPEILHNVCKSMKDGSVSVRHVKLSGVTRENIHKFLNCLSIAFRDDQVISNRNIEAYKDYVLDDDDVYIVNIFDEFISTVFVFCAEDDGANIFINRKVEIKVHENLEALNSAKNNTCNEFQRTRMDVYPE